MLVEYYVTIVRSAQNSTTYSKTLFQFATLLRNNMNAYRCDVRVHPCDLCADSTVLLCNLKGAF